MRIFFDREVSNAGGNRPELDFSVGTLEVHKSSDDSLVYRVQYNTELSLWNVDGSPKAVILQNAASALKDGTEYYVTMPAGFIKMAGGTGSPAIEKGDWTFTTTEIAYFETKETITFQTGDKDKPTHNIENVLWKDEWFINSASMTYNHELACTAMALSGASYVEGYNRNPSPNSIQTALRKFKFDEIKSYNYSYPLTADDNDHVAYTFAVKRIRHSSNDTTYLVAIIVKGTSGNEEWYSNFNIGTDDTHRGFYLAKTELMNDLEKYLADLRLTSSFKNSTKFLVVGHSRGAAVANLVAADLSYSSYAIPSNVYGYTFATPTVSTQAKEAGYENIFNIISGEDFVTQVPLGKWGFKHYGIDLLLPSRSYYDSAKYDLIYEKQMSPAYENLVGKAFEQYKEGTQAVDSLKQDVFSLASTTQEFYSKNHYLVFSPVSGLITPATTAQYFGFLADALVKISKGSEVILPISQLIMSMEGDYLQITSFFVKNHIFRPRVFSAHSMAGYYSWLR